MTTTRAYRAAAPTDAACEELLRCAGAQFDPDVVAAFLTITEADVNEPEPDAAQQATAHVRTLLARGGGAIGTSGESRAVAA